MKLASFFAAAGAFALGGVAFATVGVSFQYEGSTVHPQFGRLNRFTLTLKESNPAATINAWDVKIQSTTPAIHQVWNGSTKSAKLANTGFMSPADLNIDSHFLLPNSAIVPEVPFWVTDENSNQAYTVPSPINHGLGTLLESDPVGMISDLNSFDLAQVVLAPGKTATLTGQAVTTLNGVNVGSNALNLVIPLPADANFDNSVDLLDFDVWFSNLGNNISSNNWANADWDSSGVVDLLDFDIWFANLGSTASPGEAMAALSAVVDAETFAMLSDHVGTVPEPGAATVALGLAGVAMFNRRRRM